MLTNKTLCCKWFLTYEYNLLSYKILYTLLVMKEDNTSYYETK